MGVTHRQREIRDRTIDALPNVPLGDPLMAFADGLARLEVRIARLEARDAARDTVTVWDATPVTRDTTGDTTRDGQSDTVTAAQRHAERQRRYRERKKASA